MNVEFSSVLIAARPRTATIALAQSVDGLEDALGVTCAPTHCTGVTTGLAAADRIRMRGDLMSSGLCGAVWSAGVSFVVVIFAASLSCTATADYVEIGRAHV